MIKFLQYRAALLTVLFGLFGGAISQMLVVVDLAWLYPAIASIIALTVNLMVSFLLKGKWDKKMKNIIKITCTILFIAFVTSLYLHTKFFIENTFASSNFDGEVTYHVKGDEYTSAAIEFKQAHSYIESDDDLVREGFGLEDGKKKVWTKGSIVKNQVKLISTYILTIIFFVGLISILIEVLMGHYGKSTRKTIEAI
jgi:hypothetical protein